MPVFIGLTIVGLAGLAMMALPALARLGHVGSGLHGHVGHGGGHIALSAGHVGHGPGGQQDAAAAGRGDTGLLWLIPSPRVLFSLMTLVGAFGYALAGGAHVSAAAAGIIAIVPAVLVERLALTPLWNLLFQFEGKPSAPLEDVLLGQAHAVTAFHNGKGIVRVVHDGRVVQLRAELADPQKGMPVRVGDALLIEEVDVANERVRVSVA